MLKVKNSSSFLYLFKKAISLVVISLICLVFFNGILPAKPLVCKNIKKERQQFLKTYKQKQYHEAFSKLSEFMHIYSNAQNCHGKLIKSQIWAYSDLALAALKMNDTQKCFQHTYTVNGLVETLEGANQKPLKSLLYNYSKCMELKGGKKEAAKVNCGAGPENFCGEFKFMLIDKIDANKDFVKNKCKESNHSRGLDLSSVGQSGCLILQPFVRVDLETGGRNTCPKLIWVNGSKTNSIHVEPKKDGEFVQNEILNDNNCCSIESDRLSIMSSDSKAYLKMSGMGRDCYGGTASWFFQDIYIIDFKRKKATLTEWIYVGLH